MTLAERVHAGAFEHQDEWCKQSRRVPLRKLFPLLKLKLREYYNYYGVPSNSDGIRELFNEAMGTLWKCSTVEVNAAASRARLRRFARLLSGATPARPATARVPLRQPAFGPEARRGSEYF